MILFLVCKCNTASKEETNISIKVLANESESNINQQGLNRYDKTSAMDGYTLIDGCRIIDMEGKDVKTFPGYICDYNFENQEIVSKQLMHIVKYQSDFSIAWRQLGNAHHDIRFTKEGDVLAVVFDFQNFMGRKIPFDGIKCFSKESGEILYEWKSYNHLDNLFEVISKSFPASRLPKTLQQCESIEEYVEQDTTLFFHEATGIFKTKEKAYALTHFNSIQQIPETHLSKKNRAFQKDNFLISCTAFKFIAILDKESFEFVWVYYLWEYVGVHQPTMLSNGNILAYINSLEGGSGRKYSSIIEIEPLTKKVVWEYKENPPEKMSSSALCGVQRLPNGNTLIADNTKGGRVFEISPEEEIVWDWTNTEFDSGQNLPRRIYRARRVEKDDIEPFLREF